MDIKIQFQDVIAFFGATDAIDGCCVGDGVIVGEFVGSGVIGSFTTTANIAFSALVVLKTSVRRGPFSVRVLDSNLPSRNSDKV